MTGKLMKNMTQIRLGAILIVLACMVVGMVGCQAPTPTKAPEKESKDPSKDGSAKLAQGKDGQAAPVVANQKEVAPKPAELAPKNPKEVRGAKMLEEAQKKSDKGSKEVQSEYVNHLIATAKKEINQYNYNAAKTFLETALSIEPTNVEAQRTLSQVMASIGDASALRKDLFKNYEDRVQVMVEQARLEVRNHYAEGVEALNNKEYEKAIRAFELALETIQWNPYDLGLESLQKQVEIKINEARKSREISQIAQTQEKIKAAREQAEQIEKERQLQKIAQIERLLIQASDHYIHKKYPQAEELVEKILELDPQNMLGKRLKEDIRQAGSTHVSRSTVLKKIEAWKQTMEVVKDASIPLASLKDVVIYPDKQTWHDVVNRRKQTGLGLSENKKTQDSPSIQHIKNQLKSSEAEWSFPGMPFSDAITFIRTTHNINIVVDEAVLQKFEADKVVVSLQLKNLKLEAALNILLSFHGLTYIFKNEVLYITFRTSKSAREKPIPVLHDIRDLTGEIKDFPGPRIKLQSGGGGKGSTAGGALFTDDDQPKGPVLTGEKLTELIKTSIAPTTWKEGEDYSIAELQGQLLVVHTEAVQKEIDKFLEEMRRFSGMMVAIETRFLEVTDDFAQRVGFDWRGSGDEGLYQNDPTIDDDNRRTIMPAFLRDADVDNKGAQTAPASGLFFQESPGQNVNGRDPRPRADVRARTENIDSQALGDRMSLTGGLVTQFAFLNNLKLNAVLRLVKKSGRGELLTASRLTTFNTQRANITVISQEAYIKDFDVEVAQSAYIADPVIGTIQTGLVLDVRPIISNDRKYITLELRPTLANLVSKEKFTTSLGATGREVDFVVPQIRLQSIETTVRIPDQGTLILGGLKSFRQIDRVQDIPVLGNIPIVSFFFSQRTKIEEKQNLVIMVTAKIIDLEEEEEKAVGSRK